MRNIVRDQKKIICGLVGVQYSSTCVTNMRISHDSCFM